MGKRLLLSEVCAYYRHVKGARDLYVEGPSDARLLMDVFQSVGRMDIVAYPITSVEVDIPCATATRSNNRLKVELLAEYLAGCSPSVAGRVLCLVDADQDHFFCRAPRITFLVCTDYADMLAFFCTEGCMARVLTTALALDVDVARLFASIVLVLHELFLIRVVNLQDKWKCDNPEPHQSCSIIDGAIVLDVENYIVRLLSSKRRAAELDAFKVELSGLKIGALDYRCQLRGHDFLDIMAWYARKKCGNARHATRELLQGFFFLAHSSSDLRASRMLEQILLRLPA